jgi:hypothetical protein
MKRSYTSRKDVKPTIQEYLHLDYIGLIEAMKKSLYKVSVSMENVWYIDSPIKKSEYFTLRDELVDLFDRWNQILKMDLSYRHRMKIDSYDGIVLILLEYEDLTSGDMVDDPGWVVELDIDEVTLVLEAFYDSQDGPYNNNNEYIPRYY